VTIVYLADVGFRAAGVRLVRPVRAIVEGRTLTLGELIATPEGTDLTYYLTGLTGDEGYTPRQDVIAIRAGLTEHQLTRGAFSFGSDRSVLRRRISSTSVIPQWTGPVALDIAITGVGEFRLDAELTPFGPDTDAPRREVDASATYDGITVTVRGVGAAREETAVEIEVGVGDGECCVGLGGYAGHRLGPTALSIRDESGRVYMERLQNPGRFDHSTVALFQPLHPEARELELIVPYVFVEDPGSTEAIPLPVTSPAEAPLGRYRVRVLATARVAATSRARNATFGQPALGVDLDLGGWHGDRRVVLPGRPLLDGDQFNIGYRLAGMMNAAVPEPVDRLEITGDRALTAKTIGFTRPSVQVRGPWRIAFRLT
jgi:hypothetical protein